MRLEAFITFDALVVVVAVLAFLIDDLDAVDAAVPRVEEIEIVSISIGKGTAVGRVGAGAIDEARNELLVLRQRFAGGHAPSRRGSDRDQGQTFETHETSLPGFMAVSLFSLTQRHTTAGPMAAQTLK